MTFRIINYSQTFLLRFEDFIDEHERTPEDILEFWKGWIKRTDPEIYDIVCESYARYGMTLYDYPLKRVFPYFVVDLEKMKEGADNMNAILADLETEQDIYAIIYVGAGTGAGHVTEYRDTPAILFGLENIARLGWYHRDRLKALAYHEIGHVVHRSKRNEHGLENDIETLWYRLYEEGVAQRYEQRLKGEGSWHMETHGWVEWMEENHLRIAKIILNRIQNNENITSDLFGSDAGDPNCNFEGKIQVGYYVGCQMIKQWEDEMDDVMLIPGPEVKKKVLKYLRKFVCSKTADPR